jgi:hypothetical protein
LLRKTSAEIDKGQAGEGSTKPTKGVIIGEISLSAEPPGNFGVCHSCLLSFKANELSFHTVPSYLPFIRATQGESKPLELLAIPSAGHCPELRGIYEDLGRLLCDYGYGMLFFYLISPSVKICGLDFEVFIFITVPSIIF